MSNLTNTNIHPEVRAFVAMLCEGFNIPSSDTKLLAFADKLGNPHIPALKGTYNIFTEGRASTKKMPTIAEVMEVYKNEVKRMTLYSEQKLIHDYPSEINHNKSKEMFHKLVEAIKNGTRPIKNIIERESTGWQDGFKFTITRDNQGRDSVYFHNHPQNVK